MSEELEQMLKQLKAGLRKQNTKGATGKSKFLKRKEAAKKALEDAKKAKKKKAVTKKKTTTAKKDKE